MCDFFLFAGKYKHIRLICAVLRKSTYDFRLWSKLWKKRKNISTEKDERVQSTFEVKFYFIHILSVLFLRFCLL